MNETSTQPPPTDPTFSGSSAVGSALHSEWRGRRFEPGLPDSTINFIREHGLTALTEKFGILIRRHGEYPNLVHLKYDQLESPMGERIVQECRGLILDEALDWHVVSFPYTKFFNHGEGHAAQIDWSTSRVYEKLDGSLMVLYPYAGGWHVASSGTPDAGGPAHGAGMTFAELFWKTWDDLGYRLPETAPFDDRMGDTCFMFELMTPHNRIICHQPKSRLVLHGSRSLTTGLEMPPEPIAEFMGWECVKSFPLTTIDECMAAAQAINPMDGEGYVVRDANFNRIKVKSPQYVALSHLKEGMTGRRLLEIVRTNESSEFLSYFPEWTEAYGQVREAFDVLCGELETAYEQIKHIPVQKDFAIEAVKTRCSSALFAVRAGKCKTVREFLAQATSAAVERAVGIDQMELLPREAVAA